jgi:hypothetical protein
MNTFLLQGIAQLPLEIKEVVTDMKWLSKRTRFVMHRHEKKQSLLLLPRVHTEHRHVLSLFREHTALYHLRHKEWLFCAFAVYRIIDLQKRVNENTTVLLLLLSNVDEFTIEC